MKGSSWLNGTNQFNLSITWTCLTWGIKYYSFTAGINHMQSDHYGIPCFNDHILYRKNNISSKLDVLINCGNQMRHLNTWLMTRTNVTTQQSFSDKCTQLRNTHVFTPNVHKCMKKWKKNNTVTFLRNNVSFMYLCLSFYCRFLPYSHLDLMNTSYSSLSDSTRTVG